MCRGWGLGPRRQGSRAGRDTGSDHCPALCSPQASPTATRKPEVCRECFSNAALSMKKESSRWRDSSRPKLSVWKTDFCSFCKVRDLGCLADRLGHIVSQASNCPPPLLSLASRSVVTSQLLGSSSSKSSPSLSGPVSEPPANPAGSTFRSHPEPGPFYHFQHQLCLARDRRPLQGSVCSESRPEPFQGLAGLSWAGPPQPC